MVNLFSATKGKMFHHISTRERVRNYDGKRNISDKIWVFLQVPESFVFLVTWDKSSVGVVR